MRFLMVVLAVVLVLLQARLWLSNGGLREVWRLEAEVDAPHRGQRPARGAQLGARSRGARLEAGARRGRGARAHGARHDSLGRDVLSDRAGARPPPSVDGAARRTLAASSRERQLRILLSNDDGYQARGLRTLAEHLKPIAEVDRRGAGPQPQRRQQLADARDAAARRARRRQPLLRQRHADRLRAHRDHGPARARARRADLRHQQWRESRRRRAVFRHGGRGDGRQVSRHSVDRRVARARTAPSTTRRPRSSFASSSSATSRIRCRRT